MKHAGAAAGRPATPTRTPRDTADSSWASSPEVRGRMQRQHTRDVAPEMQLRRILHAAGLRYRVDAPPLPGLRRRADIVLGAAKVAVFVYGCFWHGCPDHGSRTPRSNADYWTGKIARNLARDADTDAPRRRWLARFATGNTQTPPAHPLRLRLQSPATAVADRRVLGPPPAA